MTPKTVIPKAVIPKAVIPKSDTEDGDTEDGDTEGSDTEGSDTEGSAVDEGTAGSAAGSLPAASCVSCHLPHQMRAGSDPLSTLSPRNLAETCGVCHRDQLVGLRMSVHAKAGDKNELGAGTLMDCNKCHGQDVHGMLPVANPASPVRLESQVAHCGDCHKEYLESYLVSVHGTGLTESGLIVTAVCADCHGAHGIFYAADKRSTLHPANVGKSCGACHHFLMERLAKSVHGGVEGVGQVGERVAPGEGGAASQVARIVTRGTMHWCQRPTHFAARYPIDAGIVMGGWRIDTD